MIFALLALLAAAPTQAFTGFTAPEAQPKRWTCQATDYQGAFGVGVAPTREEAYNRAMSDCLIRSRTGGCVITSCSAH